MISNDKKSKPQNNEQKTIDKEEKNEELSIDMMLFRI